MFELTRRRMLALPALAPALMVSAARQALAAGYGADYFPNVLLRNQDDKPVRFYDDIIKGKLVVIQFTYASCKGKCPIVTANLVQVQHLLGNRVGHDIFMYSITLKPEEDTPAVLKQHMAMHGIGPGWWFLTGRHEDVELLRRKFGQVDLDPAVDADVSQHTGMIRVGNEPYERWSACRGEARPEWIAKEILWLDGPKVRPPA
jgi:protein SCO1